jgi:toxin ParE1/3/4
VAQVTQSQQAEADLLELWLYVARNNVDAADEVLDTIERACALLATQPLMGRARPELAADVRSFPCSSWVLFYIPAADGIHVVRVLHGARDLPVAFSGA